jgi:hypothetical protein
MEEGPRPEEVVSMDKRLRWYYVHAGRTFGPVTSRQLRNLALIWQLSPEDMVRERGRKDWTPADYVEGLFPMAAAPPGHGPHITGPPA